MTHLTNKKTKPVLIFTILMMSIFSLSSCSDSDESVVSKSGEEIAFRFKSLLTGPVSGLWMLPYSEGENVYMAQSPDADKARTFCRKLIGDDKWSVDKDYIIPDSNGFIAANDPEKEGIYISLFFNVKGMETLTLHIVSPEYFNNHCNLGNMTFWIISTFSCVDCGWTSSYGFLTSSPENCPVCGGTEFKNNF